MDTASLKETVKMGHKLIVQGEEAGGDCDKDF